MFLVAINRPRSAAQHAQSSLPGEISRATDSLVGKAASVALMPMITIAETCSWYSALTTFNAGHVVEESLWRLGAT